MAEKYRLKSGTHVYTDTDGKTITLQAGGMREGPIKPAFMDLFEPLKQEIEETRTSYEVAAGSTETVKERIAGGQEQEVTTEGRETDIVEEDKGKDKTKTTKKK